MIDKKNVLKRNSQFICCDWLFGVVLKRDDDKIIGNISLDNKL